MADDWSDVELAGAVVTYKEMLSLELAHKPRTLRLIARPSLQLALSPTSAQIRRFGRASVINGLGVSHLTHFLLPLDLCTTFCTKLVGSCRDA